MQGVDHRWELFEVSFQLIDKTMVSNANFLQPAESGPTVNQDESQAGRGSEATVLCGYLSWGTQTWQQTCRSLVLRLYSYD